VYAKLTQNATVTYFSSTFLTLKTPSIQRTEERSKKHGARSMGQQEKKKKKKHHLSYRGVTIAVEGRVLHSTDIVKHQPSIDMVRTVRAGTSTVLCTRAARQADLPAQVLYPIRQLVAVSIVHTYPIIPYLTYRH